MADDPPIIRRGKGLRLSTESPEAASDAARPEDAPAVQPVEEAPATEAAPQIRRGTGFRLSTQASPEEQAALDPEEVDEVMRERDALARSGAVRWRIQTSRGPLSYLHAGSGAPLLLIHGWGASARLWAGTLADLSQQRSGYALDLPGFGQSPARPAAPTLKTLAEDVIAFADTVGLTTFELAGHSLGAAVAACVAGRYPERVSRLALVALGVRTFAPELTTLDWSRSPVDLSLGLARPFFEWWEPVNRLLMQSPPLALTLSALLLHHDPADPELWREYLADHAAVDARAYVTALTAVAAPQVREALQHIIVPTLFVAGREDRVVSLSEATSAHQLIAHSSLTVLDQCGHLPMIERPEELAQVLRRFFR
ncbi:alpha/beta hydrolase [Candidatus Chloroploca sp. M-50]|uniref:Alpha/beta hydrolase n=1 Tax=Candidatus Chloroploca mongolica TaxID=2528176 RepID=A0ABS4DDZ0_9CHLR|nr:alpha/beta hydrolase [Candidatus Chloroploca mongolica]MBP1467650.1 alpha/beta hydrolase [Candidatus Chloroploca mongolica]